MRFVCFQCSVSSAAILRGTALCTANFCRVSITIDNKRDTKVTQAHMPWATSESMGGCNAAVPLSFIFLPSWLGVVSGVKSHVSRVYLNVAMATATDVPRPAGPQKTLT